MRALRQILIRTLVVKRLNVDNIVSLLHSVDVVTVAAEVCRHDAQRNVRIVAADEASLDILSIEILRLLFDSSFQRFRIFACPGFRLIIL